MKYAPQARGAEALIARKGAVVTLSRGSGGYDPVTGQHGPSTETTTSVAVAKKPSGADVTRFQALSMVPLPTLLLIIAGRPLAFAPMPNDRVEWAGDTYTVRDVATLAPDGADAILYSVAASR